MSAAPTNDVDVAIIGAGISGLAVARGMHAVGRSVRVYEARPRAGGRVLSTAVPGGHADLGPTWFWPGETRILSLVTELGLAVHDQFATGDALVADREAVHRARFAAPPAFRFSDGAQSLTSALAAAIPADTIAFDTPVERIERTGGHVVVRTATGSTTAAAVVLALPPSLAIASGMVDPATLDSSVAETAAHTPVWMGGITKAVAVYGRAFWRDLGLSGTVSALFEPFAEIHDMSGPDGSPAMLFGFGRAAGRGAPTADAFVDQLVGLFGPAAAAPIEVVAFDWSAEAFTMPPAGNGSERYELYGSPLLRTPSWDGRLHWASTETGAVAPGHLEGALEAAERAVRQLTAELSPASAD